MILIMALHYAITIILEREVMLKSCHHILNSWWLHLNKIASFNKINNFTFAVLSKLHNLGTGGDALKIALTNTAHTSSWTRLSDLTEISYTFCSTRALTQTLSTSSGTAKLVLTDLVLTASGGAVGPFRYVYIYNDTATNKDLIGYYDYGSAYTMADTTTFTIDFDGTNGVLTIA